MDAKTLAIFVTELSKLPSDLFQLTLAYIHPQWIRYATDPTSIVEAENAHKYFIPDVVRYDFDWYMALIRAGALEPQTHHIYSIITNGTIEDVEFLYTTHRYQDIIIEFGYSNHSSSESILELAVGLDRADVVEFLIDGGYEFISEEELRSLLASEPSDEIREYLEQLCDVTSSE